MLIAFFIAVGLAMDAFAVSIASGLTQRKLRTKHALRMAFSFGLFQAFMPVVGWLVGSGVKSWIEAVDHWVAFLLLTIIGGRMMLRALKKDSQKEPINPFGVRTLLILSIATSIDALVVGLGISFLEIEILPFIIIIGLVTFVFSLMGLYFGKRFGHHCDKVVYLVGGLILIGIGIKTLIEHMT